MAKVTRTVIELKGQKRKIANKAESDHRGRVAGGEDWRRQRVRPQRNRHSTEKDD